FQNMTSLGVAYFTINPYKGDGAFNQEALDKMPAVNETEHLRHVRLGKPCTAKVDGAKKKGVVVTGE
ncbi:MAG: hypothetical protein SPJ79_03195, partial [Prevotella sp.]|nr:hypothetical protein [Bacteroidales bacterium]MDY5876577.1 hypothetical protein [Prevotella sp.]